MVITALSMMILVIFWTTLVPVPTISIPPLGSVITDGYRGVVRLVVICTTFCALYAFMVTIGPPLLH